MVEKKRKRRSERNKKKEEKRKGPRLPNALRKHLERLNPKPDVNDEINSDEEENGLLHVPDVYEYEEPVAEEELRKNRRFDPVENFEYELPEEFEDENLSSSDDDKGDDGNRSDQSGDEGEGEDDRRHARMLQGITGMPAEAFEGNKKTRIEVVTEAYPEGEYNPSRSGRDGDGPLTIQDFLDSLHQKRGYSELRKTIHRQEKKSLSIDPPLSKAIQENLERKVAYDQTKKDITKWEPLIKKNRESPTIFFNEDTDIGYSTVGAIASEFEPRTAFEKKMTSIVHDPTVMEAYKEDGARLLELNEISVEAVKDRHNHLAKLRSYLFRQEMKAKHIKKIKSKTFHRLLKKDKLKATLAEMEMDPEAAKEQAIKQEFKRAQERMTLKHINNNKWSKRILKRGLDAQPEGTRAAISEQLHQHNVLTRKMNSVKDSSSSDESSEDDDDNELPDGMEKDGVSKLLTKARDKTIKAMEEDHEIPASGLLSLPFMARAEKKKKEEAQAEAKLAVEEFETSMKQLEDSNVTGSSKEGTASGRRVFGAVKKHPEESNSRHTTGNYDSGSDNEDDFNNEESVNVDIPKSVPWRKDVRFDGGILHGELEIGGDRVLKSLDDISGALGHKATNEVSIFVSDSWRKMGSNSVRNRDERKSLAVVEQELPHKELKKEVEDDGDTDSEEMVDGVLTSGNKPDYELPSQADLIHLAFAGDDVEEDFEKDKLEVVNEENPEPEKPLLLPGWGQWTHIQQKKGMPSWMREEHENAKRKREDVLQKRKDAHLKHVIISEKVNKKAEKLHTKTLPFPYTSKEVFEQSMRVPIGPEYNPATSIGALNRPEVVKKPGIIIKPIKYEDVDPYDKANGHKQGDNQKTKKTKNNSGKTIKKIKAKGKN